MRERAAADGAAVAPDHAYVDEGRSGARLARPALERLRGSQSLTGEPLWMHILD